MRAIARRNLLFLLPPAISSYFLCAPTKAYAQTGPLGLNTTMGTLVVDRESAALMFNGQRYSLVIQGARSGSTATNAAPFVAIVYNLRSPIDIVGTYVTAAPTDTAPRDAKTILLQNSSGVVLRFDVKGGESETSPLNLEGLTITMQ